MKTAAELTGTTAFLVDQPSPPMLADVIESLDRVRGAAHDDNGFVDDVIDGIVADIGDLLDRQAICHTLPQSLSFSARA